MATPGAIRSASALSLIYATIDPRKSSTAPPNLWNVPSVSEPIEYEGRFNIGSDVISATYFGPVPTRRGMVLWLPNRGVNSIARMGFIPAGHVETAGVGPAGHQVLPTQATFGGVSSRPASITFDAPLAVPYNNQIEGDQITSSPDLGIDFSTARLNSAVMEMDSSTLPDGVTSLNGVFCESAVSDTTAISQKQASAAAPYQAYSVADLTTSAISPQEALKNVSVADGVTTVIGPEFPPTFTNPDADTQDKMSGTFFKVASGDLKFDAVTQIGGTGAQGVSQCVFSAWVSPWETTAPPVAGVSTPLAGNNRIITKRINEYGKLDIDLIVRAGLNPQNGFQGCKYKVWASAVHHYCTCRSDGGLDWYTTTDQSGDTVVVTTTNYYDTHEVAKVHRFRPSMDTVSFVDEDGGKYVGTFLTYSVAYLEVGATGDNALITLDVASIDLTIRARDINVRGEVGPARIIRWDGVGVGQVLDFSGFGNAQCVAQSRIAAYVKTAITTGNETLDVNIIPFIAALYNNTMTPLKRNWIKAEYRAMIRTLFEHLSFETIQEWAQRHPELAAGAEAAGFFDSLVNGLNRGLQYVERGAERAARLAGTVGALAATGTAVMGAFADGEFGASSGGQFGSSASGQFDAQRRMRLFN